MGIFDAIFRGRKPAAKLDDDTEQDSGIQIIIRELDRQDQWADERREIDLEAASQTGRTSQVSPAQVSPVQVSATQVSATQLSQTQVSQTPLSRAQVSAAERTDADLAAAWAAESADAEAEASTPEAVEAAALSAELASIERSLAAYVEGPLGERGSATPVDTRFSSSYASAARVEPATDLARLDTSYSTTIEMAPAAPVFVEAVEPKPAYVEPIDAEPTPFVASAPEPTLIVAEVENLPARADAQPYPRAELEPVEVSSGPNDSATMTLAASEPTQPIDVSTYSAATPHAGGHDFNLSPRSGTDTQEDEPMDHGDAHEPEASQPSAPTYTAEPEGESSHPWAGSMRQSQFEAFKAITNEMEEKLRQFSEAVSLSRLTVSSMQPFMANFESDIQIADQVERERNELAVEAGELRRSLEIAQRDLAMRIATLNVANERNNELRMDLEQSRLLVQDLSVKLEKLRKDQERSVADIVNARGEITRLTAALDREAAEKESIFQSRVELGNKYAKLQQAEAQARSKHLELTVQYDKLLKSQPPLIAELEKLRNELRVSQREKPELHNRLVSAQDRIAQLENELHSQQGFLASEAFASRTELDMHQSALRNAEKSIAETEQRNKELQRQLREAEASRNMAETQAAMVQQELDEVRRERAESAFKLSDVNIKYMTDLLSLDQQREQNKEFQYDIESLLEEKQRLAKFESMFKASQSQIAGLKDKLTSLAEDLKGTSDPEQVRRSLETLGEMILPQLAANTDKPQRAGTKKVMASH